MLVLHHRMCRRTVFLALADGWAFLPSYFELVQLTRRAAVAATTPARQLHYRQYLQHPPSLFAHYCRRAANLLQRSRASASGRDACPSFRQRFQHSQPSDQATKRTVVTTYLVIILDRLGGVVSWPTLPNLAFAGS